MLVVGGVFGETSGGGVVLKGCRLMCRGTVSNEQTDEERQRDG